MKAKTSLPPKRWSLVRAGRLGTAFAAIPLLVGMTGHGPSASRHSNPPPQVQLYEAAGDHIQAFAVSADGLPAKQPDWKLTGGFSAAVSVALDAAGYIYVADYNLNNIKVFAPGSSGNAAPVREIPLYSPILVAVNKAGYLFVTYNNQYTVSVYAPGAGGAGSPTPLPIHIISFSGQVADLVVDAFGRLYVDFGASIVYYNDPVHSWQLPDGMITVRGNETYVYSPIAVDETTHDFYFHTYVQNHFGRWQAAVHAGRSLTTHERDLISETKDCDQSSGTGFEYSLAVTKGYLMFTCDAPFDLFVYKKAAGKQRPVEVLPLGYGIVLWPDLAPTSTEGPITQRE